MGIKFGISFVIFVSKYLINGARVVSFIKLSVSRGKLSIVKQIIFVIGFNTKK